MTALNDAWLPTSPPVPGPQWPTTEGAAAPVLVVHVWAPWNAYDRVVDAHLTAIRNHAGISGALIRSINSDLQEFWPALRAWHVVNLPALVFFRRGQHQATLTGVLSAERLESLISEHLSELPLNPSA